MQRRLRWPLWLGLFLCAALLLLCLSALIEAPAAAVGDPPRPVRLAVQFETALPLAPEPVTASRPQWDGLRTAALLLLATALALPSAARDANGRVLRRRQYVKCYYPLFRLQLAAG